MCDLATVQYALIRTWLSLSLLDTPKIGDMGKIGRIQGGPTDQESVDIFHFGNAFAIFCIHRT